MVCIAEHYQGRVRRSRWLAGQTPLQQERREGHEAPEQQEKQQEKRSLQGRVLLQQEQGLTIHQKACR